MTANALPDFIVIGAMRAGTTTLYHHLSHHPDIGMSRMKETDFFVSKMNWPLGLDWYQSQFDPGFALKGEVSPNYAMCHLWQGVPRRMHDTIPDAKLIFLARDPVDRFFSHYLHNWHLGRARVLPDQILGTQTGDNMLNASRYAIQIKAFLEFYPMDRVHILDFDLLRRAPQDALDHVTDFLGVDRRSIADDVATRNDAGSISRMPAIVQRAWRSRGMRHFDRFISRDMRDRRAACCPWGRPAGPPK